MEPAVQQLWDAFRRLHPRLAAEAEELGETYDALLEAVQKIDPGLYLEMCVGKNPKEFIITAEGSKELFPLVEDIVRAAPPVPGWTFLALKPRLGFPETADWEGIEVVIANVRFMPLVNKEGGLALRLFVPRLHPENQSAVHNALLRALDHGLGERAFAEQIDATFVAPTPESAENLLKLTELEAYLEWRRRK